MSCARVSSAGATGSEYLGRQLSALWVLGLVGGATVLLPQAIAARAVPFLSGPVVDEAEVLTAAEEEGLAARLRQFQSEFGPQVAVLTVTSLEDEELEGFSLRIAETWKLGRQGQDDGVLLLLAVADRKMRIEVGYGLEGRLTDAQSGRILNEILRPHLKRGEFGAGTAAAVDAILGTLRGEPLSASAEGEGSAERPPLHVLLVFLGLFGVVVGTFSVVAVLSPAPGSWFLYVFLMPFYLMFPMVLGPAVGVGSLLTWATLFPLLRYWLRGTAAGKAWVASHASLAAFAAATHSTGSRRSGGWSWGGGSSSGGGSYSGGGGSFGGGGASSSW